MAAGEKKTEGVGKKIKKEEKRGNKNRMKIAEKRANVRNVKYIPLRKTKKHNFELSPLVYFCD